MEFRTIKEKPAKKQKTFIFYQIMQKRIDAKITLNKIKYKT